jgi:hypothetical protein
MMGKLMIARIHGMVESILLERANSMAPADHGVVKTRVMMAVVFGMVVLEFGGVLSSAGEMSGEEKERR